MALDATTLDRGAGTRNARLIAVLFAATASVGSTCLAAVMPPTSEFQPLPMVTGAGFAMAAGIALIFWKGYRGLPRVTAIAIGILSCLVVLSVLGACSLLALDAPRRHRIAKLVDELEAKGFYRHAPLEAAGKSRTFRTIEDVIFDKSTGRAFWCDLEELSQGGAMHFMVSVNAFLRKDGLSIHTLNISYEIGGGYVLRIDDLEYQLYSRQESTSPRLGELCAARVAKAINAHLESAGSKEHFRAFSHAGTCRGVFLADSQWSCLGVDWTLMEVGE